MKKYGFASLFLLGLASCAVVPGPPPLGLGPGLDQLVSLVVICLLAFLGFKFGPDFLKRYQKPSGTAEGPETEETILRRRYARGEIARDQYFQILEDLGHKR